MAQLLVLVPLTVSQNKRRVAIPAVNMMDRIL